MRIKFLAILLALSALPALAHVNDARIDYTRYRDINGRPCCTDTDCRPADDFAEVAERGQVRLLTASGSTCRAPK